MRFTPMYSYGLHTLVRVRANHVLLSRAIWPTQVMNLNMTLLSASSLTLTTAPSTGRPYLRSLLLLTICKTAWLLKEMTAVATDMAKQSQ